MVAQISRLFLELLLLSPDTGIPKGGPPKMTGIVKEIHMGVGCLSGMLAVGQIPALGWSGNKLRASVDGIRLVVNGLYNLFQSFCNILHQL